MKSHFDSIDQVNLPFTNALCVPNQCLFLGLKSERDQGTAETVPSSQHHSVDRGAIVRIRDVDKNVCSDEPTGRLALVFELMEMNLYEAIKGNDYSLMGLVFREA